jgi:GNAT superfamily N-acetyltransferase
MTIRNATLADIPLIQQLAEKTWWPTYSPIVPAEQITYMLGAVYSTEVLTNAIEAKLQSFIILYDENGAQGFASYGSRPENPSIYKLHKLYVLPENQGKGYGLALIDYVKTQLRSKNIGTLELNVNRFNKAKNFYEKVGFTVVREEDVAIGAYWMNDFVMRLEFGGN